MERFVFVVQEFKEWQEKKKESQTRSLTEGRKIAAVRTAFRQILHLIIHQSPCNFTHGD
jgi:hypothetical protein